MGTHPWLGAAARPDLVLLVLGDHQPHSPTSPAGPGHDVRSPLVARDPAVLRRIADWGWQPGIHPHPRRRSGRWPPSATGSSARWLSVSR